MKTSKGISDFKEMAINFNLNKIIGGEVDDPIDRDKVEEPGGPGAHR